MESGTCYQYVDLKALKKIGGCGLVSFLLQRELKRHSHERPACVHGLFRAILLTAQPGEHASRSYQVFISKEEHGTFNLEESITIKSLYSEHGILDSFQ